jgi:hypothetical protein
MNQETRSLDSGKGVYILEKLLEGAAHCTETRDCNPKE